MARAPGSLRVHLHAQARLLSELVEGFFSKFARARSVLRHIRVASKQDSDRNHAAWSTSTRTGSHLVLQLKRPPDMIIKEPELIIDGFNRPLSSRTLNVVLVYAQKTRTCLWA